jgi:hypothetical protein
MATQCSKWCVAATILAVLIGAYFLSFPQDSALLAGAVATVLSWTSLISPWLYGLVAVWLVCQTALRISCARRNP